MTLRRREKTASGKPKSKTHDAPNEPNIRGWLDNWLRQAIVAMAKLAANAATMIWAIAGLGGNLLLVLVDFGCNDIVSFKQLVCRDMTLKRYPCT